MTSSRWIILPLQLKATKTLNSNKRRVNDLLNASANNALDASPLKKSRARAQNFRTHWGEKQKVRSPDANAIPNQVRQTRVKSVFISRSPGAQEAELPCVRTHWFEWGENAPQVNPGQSTAARAVHTERTEPKCWGKREQTYPPPPSRRRFVQRMRTGSVWDSQRFPVPLLVTGAHAHHPFGS